MVDNNKVLIHKTGRAILFSIASLLIAAVPSYMANDPKLLGLTPIVNGILVIVKDLIDSTLK
jgi:hypothetical protein